MAEFNETAPDGYRLEWDPNGLPVAWLDRIDPATGEKKEKGHTAMEYRNDGRWGPTQSGLICAESLDEVNRVMDWLQTNFPQGRSRQATAE